MPVPGGMEGAWGALAEGGDEGGAEEKVPLAATDEPFPDPFPLPFPLGAGPRSTLTTVRSSDAK
jgi:hypothetical protein